jgi:RNA polymerase sigma factor (TIGR02999 family)
MTANAPTLPDRMGCGTAGSVAMPKELPNELFPQVYTELRALAQRHLSQERRGHTLAPTELVHEVYLRLFDGELPDYANRAHFFHSVAEAMRRILIEHARRKGSIKRGGGRQRIDLTLAEPASEENPQDLLALNEAIVRLEEKDARAAEVVRLRYFAGLSIDQTAQAMDLSPRTVKREWEFARAWLLKSLK